MILKICERQRYLNLCAPSSAETVRTPLPQCNCSLSLVKNMGHTESVASDTLPQISEVPKISSIPVSTDARTKAVRLSFDSRLHTLKLLVVKGALGQ